mmetsp:Transcript_45995/g.55773  ORF Transcript_45995/g.55773 Transcript_45995/m.55773 type:complete len:481 (-) Transcript_45995:96-1538(-)
MLKKEMSQIRCDEIVEADLRHKLKHANTSKEHLESKVEMLEKKIQSVTQEKDEIIEKLDALVANKEAILEELEASKRAVVSGEETLSNLKAELDELKKNAEKKTAWSLARESRKLDEAASEIQSLKAKNNTLVKEINQLKEKLNALANEAESVPKLKAMLENSDNDRAIFEEKALANFERKISLLKMEKDITIDKLRQELADAKEIQCELETTLKNQISSLELSNETLQTGLESKIQRKNAKILALEQKMAAQDQVYGNMRQEMDQLQNSMERATMIRRAEIEEMQQEVMDRSARATKQEREISKLKMLLEERKLRHKAEVSKLLDKISALEKDSPLARGIQTARDDRKIEELNDTITKLKWQNVSLLEDCKKLREKIQKYEEEKKAMSKNDKWRNSALSEQVKILTKRIKELEVVPQHSSSRSKSSVSSNAERSSASRVKAISGESSPRDVYQYPSAKEDHQPTIISRDDISTTTKFTF